MNTTTVKPSSLFFDNKKALDASQTIEAPDLTQADRCDACSGPALVRARKGEQMELLFCARHARLNLTALVADGWRLNDQTYKAFDSYSASKTS